MEWWDRVAFPMRRVWIGVTTRLGLRKTGLGRLRKEVSTCEYEDVHVMWELLRRTDAEVARMRPGEEGGREGAARVGCVRVGSASGAVQLLPGLLSLSHL
uniref:Uncharacterized protein LOC105032524 n=1 Tax=Elaeis guineensis var. tenera TaxID=51953 RepID=A0A6I9Q9Z2_ELAGV|nr:uncharacterized protein LOC105032524 [Elaeis guineensis]